MNFFTWVLFFYAYSFLGWIAEVMYCSILNKKLVNRGFLYEPICPIYGFGAVFLLLLLSPFKENFFLVLLLGVLVTTSLEYITSFLMEKIFKLRWWDYSNRRFNLNGRVCLLNSSMFAGLCIFLVYFLHPFMMDVIDLLPFYVPIIVSALIISGVVVDLIFSIIKVSKLNVLIEKVSLIKENINENYDGKITVYLEKHFIKRFPRLSSIKNNISLTKIKNKLVVEIKEKVSRVKTKVKRSKRNE